VTFAWVRISKAAELTGYTVAAIESKIRDGVWLEGQVWAKAPDGRILISIEGYNSWAAPTTASPQRPRARSKSPLPIGAPGAASDSNSSPRPLT
jgi:hypothetical protein